jgi:protein required for attachment to host cells
MSNQWVVVADKSRARIFAMDDPAGPLREIEDLIHPEGRQPVRELRSDRPARVFRGKGEATHPVDHKIDPKEQEAVNFARRIAARIEHGQTRDGITRWVLIAPPSFLGVIRAELSAAVKDHLVKTVDKNLVQQTEAKIREHLMR